MEASAKFADASILMRKIGFIVVLLRGLLRLVFLFVLSEHFRCRTRSGPHTVGWRFCAVQAFCRRQNLGAGAIHLPRAFKRSQDSIKITTPDGVVIFMSCP